MHIKSLLISMSILSILLFACKPQEGATPKEAEVAEAANEKEPQKMDTTFDASVFDKEVPDACTLLSPAFIASTFGVDAGAITVKDGSSSMNTKARSCFFKWQTDLPNSGILVQALKNPVAEEFPDWVTYFVKTKKQDGEKSFSDPGVVYRYEDWPVVGDEGAASVDAGKYVWRVGNEMAFMIAFNLSIDAASQRQAAASLAQEVMSNL